MSNGVNWLRRAMRLRREITCGGRRPAGWRTAWYDPMRRARVCYPAPLHWVMRVAHDVAWRARVALRAPSKEKQQERDAQVTYVERRKLAAQYAEGYMSGWRECFEACMEAVVEEAECRDEVTH